MACRQGGRATEPRLSPEALALLHGYAWPGNVRELRNVIERAVLLAPGDRILPEHLPAEKLAPASLRRPSARISHVAPADRAAGAATSTSPRWWTTPSKARILRVLQRVRLQPDPRRRGAGHVAAHARLAARRRTAGPGHADRGHDSTRAWAAPRFWGG